MFTINIQFRQKHITYIFCWVFKFIDCRYLAVILSICLNKYGKQAIKLIQINDHVLFKGEKLKLNRKSTLTRHQFLWLPFIVLQKHSFTCMWPMTIFVDFILNLLPTYKRYLSFLPNDIKITWVIIYGTIGLMQVQTAKQEFTRLVKLKEAA